MPLQSGITVIVILLTITLFWWGMSDSSDLSDMTDESDEY